MGSIDLDFSEVSKGLARLKGKMIPLSRRALTIVANEAIRLSSFEVPHDKGGLQNSATVQDEGDDVIAGYNKEYAARLHEHPEYRFQKGRKGKYLEDPIKRNAGVLNHFLGESAKADFNG